MFIGNEEICSIDVLPLKIPHETIARILAAIRPLEHASSDRAIELLILFLQSIFMTSLIRGIPDARTK